MIAWGQGINAVNWGKIYNQSWVGEYIFLTCVGDGNDYEVRLAAASATIEAHACLVNNMNKSLK